MQMNSIIDDYQSTVTCLQAVETSTPTISVEPNASVEGSVASVKEVHVTSKGAIEIQSQDLWSTLSSEEHFKWLQDAAQVVIIIEMHAWAIDSGY